MNVVFLSPHFPPNWYHFVVGLRSVGATHARHRRSELGARCGPSCATTSTTTTASTTSPTTTSWRGHRLVHQPPRPGRSDRLAQRALARDRGRPAHATSTSPASTARTIGADQAQVAHEEALPRRRPHAGARPRVQHARPRSRGSSRKSAIRSSPSPTSASVRRKTYKLEND